ncbi:hypothetical protein Rsub_03192 [Raphidocelis subcapitata]|uniref:ABC-type xenobiotic transporter n=1 Tax=Raphidocelis subcapitata TaxID=307507 RepID=A0A2V0NYF4_9CHLO|nr:hypothetical protein Rsub_03192 [Raphidocelis subcapitata]|eukprot:GBF90620.1 hypothetical protein Rsub_03192 [Raphidocelis subcapitata]
MAPGGPAPPRDAPAPAAAGPRRRRGALWFGWVSPLTATGVARQLQDSDLPAPPPGAAPGECADALWQEWLKELRRAAPPRPDPAGPSPYAAAPARPPRPPSLLAAMARAYGRAYLPLTGLRLVNDLLMLLMPLLLKLLVEHVDGSRGGGGSPAVNGGSPAVNGGFGGPAAVGGWAGAGSISSAWPAHVLPPAARRVIDGPNGGFVFAALLGLAAGVKALLGAHYEYRINVVANRLRAGLMACLYNQSLLARAADASGCADAATLMGVDAGRALGLMPSFMELWSLPLQLAVAMWLLYTQVRFAFVAGVALCLAMLPINRLLAGRIQKASIQMMAHKDERVSLMAELLHGVRVVKALSWEPAFVSRLGRARRLELRQLAVRKYLDAMCVYFWAATQLLFSVLTFGLMALLGIELRPSVVFTSLALFNMLIAPLNSIPWVINGIVEAFVSIRRLRAFLSLPQHAAAWAAAPLSSRSPRPPPAAVAGRPGPAGGGGGAAGAAPLSPGEAAARQRVAEAEKRELRAEGAVAILENATFAWRETQRAVLHDVTCSVPAGRLTVVVGEVGAGKSSVLAALLGELRLSRGRAAVDAAELFGPGGVGYVGQAPWVVGGTVRDNVLMGEPYDPEWLQQVLHAAALDTDLAALPAGDLTRVGDRGSTLSGGQRQRLALARVLYRRCGVYLLDDVLSAVDAHCAQWLIRHALLGGLVTRRPGGGGGGEGDPTVVMVTKHPALIQAAEQVLALERGRLAFCGDPTDYARWKGERTPPLTSTAGRLAALGLPTEGGSSIVTDTPFALPCTLPDAPETPPAPNAALDAAVAAISASAEGAASEDLDPRELRRSLEDGEAVWQPHASETPQLESISEADGDEEVGASFASSLPEGLAARGRSAAAATAAAAAAAAAAGGDPSEAAAAGAGEEGPDADDEADGEAAGAEGTAGSAAAAGGAEGPADQEEQEERVVGAVRWPVYESYLQAVGWPMVAAVLISLALMQATKNGTDVFVAHWIARARTNDAAAGPGLAARGWGPDGPAPQPWLGLAARPAAPGRARQLGEELQSWRQQLWQQEPSHPVWHPSAARPFFAAAFPPLDPWARGFLFGLLVFAGANTLFTLARAFTFAVAGMAAARRTHDGLLRAVLLAPVAFFDRHAVGRILNRFSSDVSTVDDTLPFMSNILLANAASLAGLVAVLTYTEPRLLAALLPLGLLYKHLQGYYRATSRELRRLEAVARSPIYGALGDATHGANFIRLVGPYQRATLAAAAASAWLSLRLQLLAACLVAAVSTLAAAAAAAAARGGAAPSPLQASLVGLALAYCLPMVGVLNSLLTSMAETEQEMVSVERIRQYFGTPSEAATESEAREMLEGPPRPSRRAAAAGGGGGAEARRRSGGRGRGRAQTGKGPSYLRQQMQQRRQTAGSGGDVEAPLLAPLLEQQQQSATVAPGDASQIAAASGAPAIVFSGVWLRYRPSDRPALRGLSFEVPQGCRLGICGRTGAGKSSVIAALLRLTPIIAGRISVLGNDAASLPLPALRRRFAVVPQAPLLFSGSLRDNLDPLGAYSEDDEELAMALEAVQMWEPLCRLALHRGHLGSAGYLASRRVGGILGRRLESRAAHAFGADGAGPRAASPDGEGGAGRGAGRRRDGSPPLPISPQQQLRLPERPIALVMRMPIGGAGGPQLSTGQQQLLCLARALLRRAHLVLLDECTSSVDPATAALMVAVLERELSGRTATVLQIAHDLRAISGYDRVLLMDRGRVVEEGDPRELAATRGSRFAQLLARAVRSGGA